MVGYSQDLKFDINIIRLSNLLDQELEGDLFIRYSVSTLDARKIQVDTKEIHSTNDLSSSEYASFECHANSDIMSQPSRLRDIKFELRLRRRKNSVFGRMEKSRLLGIGEISWKEVIESMEMRLEKWVKFSVMDDKVKHHRIKLPNLLVDLRIQMIRSIGNANGKRRCDVNRDYFGSQVDMFHVETLVD